MSHPTSRKRNCQYFKGKAKCKIPSCQVVIKLSITKQSVVIGAPKVNVTTSGKLVHKNNDKFCSRNLSGEKRLQVAKSISDVGADNYYYQQFERAKTYSIHSGNVTDICPAEVLRKAHSEHNNREIISTDPRTDIYYTMINLRTADQQSQHVIGYIQDISILPFRTIMYSESQISLFVNHCKKNVYPKIFIDATGSLVSSKNLSEKMIYYYAMIIHHETQGPIPVCEMLTSDQTTPNLTYFFIKWLRNLHEVSINCAKRIKHIEIDQSWALLHSTCQAFNKTSLLGYLENSWKILNSKDEFSITTTIHFCSAHVIHRFRVNLKEISMPSKSTLHYAISCFATLQICTSLNYGKEIFHLICIIFTSQTQNQECTNAMIKMDQFMESMNEPLNQNEDKYNSIILCFQNRFFQISFEKNPPFINVLLKFGKKLSLI